MTYRKLEIISGEEPETSIQVEDEKLIEVDREIADREALTTATGGTIQVRRNGELGGGGFYLSSYYDWVLGKDDGGVIVLVPLKK